MFLNALKNFTVKKLRLPIYFVPTIGLGNQLFQLSALINVSQQCDRKVYVCWDEHVGASFQELTQFLKVYNYNNFLKIKLPFIFQVYLRIYRKFCSFDPLGLVLPEKFDDYMIRKSQPVFVYGYYQSYKYVSNVKKELSKMFVVDSLIDQTEILNQIERTSSVAIHVRRGDYTTSHAAMLHGLKGYEYYSAAVSEIGRGSNEFYIFSDDPIASRELVDQLGLVATIIQPSLIPSTDLFLMSKCKKIIIANSTYSWWAAYISNAEKVVAPREWFADAKLSKVYSDILMPNWIAV
jgi:Glycosyl transferase family 11